jgi:molybdenum cofactor cytidylyltransferase
VSVSLNRQTPATSRTRVGAVLLAAGQGSRMGGCPKALLQRQGVPLIEHHLKALRAVGVDTIVVVTGYYHEDIEPLLQSAGLTVVRNPKPEAGQPSSVRLGIEAIGADFDAVIMMLCDQPLIDASDLQALLEAFRLSTPAQIIVPRVHGLRGNPTVFSGQAMATMLKFDGQMYCRRFMDENPQLVQFMDTTNEHFIADVDTPEDLIAFEKRFGERLTIPLQPASER